MATVCTNTVNTGSVEVPLTTFIENTLTDGTEHYLKETEIERLRDCLAKTLSLLHQKGVINDVELLAAIDFTSYEINRDGISIKA